MTDALMIEAHALAKRFGSTQALAGLDLQVPAGSILGVLGPNGAGKTNIGLRHFFARVF
jgi:ABC-type multidrug transport system ATPase subunit